MPHDESKWLFCANTIPIIGSTVKWSLGDVTWHFACYIQSFFFLLTHSGTLLRTNLPWKTLTGTKCPLTTVAPRIIRPHKLHHNKVAQSRVTALPLKKNILLGCLPNAFQRRCLSHVLLGGEFGTTLSVGLGTFRYSPCRAGRQWRGEGGQGISAQAVAPATLGKQWWMGGWIDDQFLISSMFMALKLLVFLLCYTHQVRTCGQLELSAKTNNIWSHMRVLMGPVANKEKESAFIV